MQCSKDSKNNIISQIMVIIGRAYASSFDLGICKRQSLSQLHFLMRWTRDEVSKHPYTKGHISEKWVSAFPQESCHLTLTEQFNSSIPFGYLACLRSTKITNSHKRWLIKSLEDLEYPQRPTLTVNYHPPRDSFLHEKKCRVTSLMML